MNSSSHDGYFASCKGRKDKAKKIEAVISNARRSDRLTGLQILDIGCGSGHIAAHFAEHNDVTGVDIIDQRVNECRGKFAFVNASAFTLPFAENSFDIVISNQVIFYLPRPMDHLFEIKRVLRKSGCAYLTMSNRAFPIEPHSHLPLIHYLPAVFFNGFMHTFFGWRHGVYLFSHRTMCAMLKDISLRHRDCSIDIIRYPERYNSDIRLPFRRLIPRCASALLPTNIFLLFK